MRPSGTNTSLSVPPASFDSGLKICQIGFAVKSVGHIPQAAASGMNLPDRVLNYFKLQSIDFKSKAIFYVTALAAAAAWCSMASGAASLSTPVCCENNYEGGTESNS